MRQLPCYKVLEHHGGVETAIPHLCAAVVSGLQIEVVFNALVAPFG